MYVCIIFVYSPEENYPWTDDWFQDYSENMQDELAAFCTGRKIKKCGRIKIEHDDGCISKRHRSWLKELSTAKPEKTWATK